MHIRLKREGWIMVYLPSLSCADLLNLEADVKELIRAGHSLFHIDLMDGHYVPNLCLNLDFVRALKERFDCTIDVHLMVEDPFSYVQACADAQGDYLSFHFDAVYHPYRLLTQIQSCGMKAGIVLNPGNRPEDIADLAKIMDYCLIMSVEPGFYGQKFMDVAYKKIQYLDILRKRENLHFQISVDGGIDVESGKKCKLLGADMMVMGVFSFFHQKLPIYDACREYVEKIEGDQLWKHN